MTVSQLIDHLKRFNPDQEVFFSQSSGDYWNTTLAIPVSKVTESDLIHSDYHCCLRFPSDGYDETDEDLRVNLVVIS